MIGAGLGIGLVPAISRQEGIRAPVTWVRIDAPDCHRVLSLVWHRDAHLSEAARAFRTFITSTPFLTHRFPPARDTQP